MFNSTDNSESLHCYSEPLWDFFFLTASFFLLIFNSTSLNKRKDLEEDCLVFLLQATKTHFRCCIYQCLERTRGNAWVVATQCTQTKPLNLSVLKKFTMLLKNQS